MSYFNSEQEGRMTELAKIDPAQRCWCGWYRLGDCGRCPKEKTCADKIAVMCPSCGNAPDPHDGRFIHIAGCKDAVDARKVQP